MQASAILIVVWMLFRAIGAAGFPLFTSWKSAFSYAFAVMLIFTAFEHSKRREELLALVPRCIVDPGAVVFTSRVSELLPASRPLFRVPGFEDEADDEDESEAPRESRQ